MTFRKILLTICLVGAFTPLSYAENFVQTDKTDNFVLGDEMPSDFGFRYEYGVNGLNVLDTFNETLTVDLIHNGHPIIPFRLSDSDLKEIFVALKRNKFGNLRENNPESKRITIPDSFYKLTLRCNQKEKTLSIHGNVYDRLYGPDAARWKEVIQVINRIINKQCSLSEEFKKLPPVEGGYE